MTFNPQNITALGQAQIEKTVRLSTNIMQSAERLISQQIELTLKHFTTQAQAFSSLSSIRDPGALLALQSSLAQPTIDFVQAAARNVFEAAAAAQHELTTFAEAQHAENNQTLASSLDHLSKHAPAGSEVAVSAFKQMISHSNSAFETASKTAKHVGAEFNKAGIQAANQSVATIHAAVKQAQNLAATAVAR